ncbi:MAG: NrpR regulatory domain-containing protein [Lentisphaeria bacterium]|jgi:hypothetical protein
MPNPLPRTTLLRALREAGGSAGSAELARQLQAAGQELSPRSVRLHLQRLEAEGFVQPARRGRGGGRAITERGLAEIKDAAVQERIGFTAARMDEMACRMSFNLETLAGQIVLNLTIVREPDLRAALAEMRPAMAAGLGMGHYAALFATGETVGTQAIPPGHAGIGTLCSVTVNGLLLNARIPTVSRFAGVLELRAGEPVRFTDLISYAGTTLDPLEIFIKSGLTRVRDAARTGTGRIGASFREIPTCALAEAERLFARLRACGLGGLLKIGRPNQPLLGLPVPEGRTAILVAGGLNPCAAFQEIGIPGINTALSQLYDFRRLRPCRELLPG